LQTEKAEVANRLAALADEMEKARGNSDELLKLRGEVSRLRREANDPANSLAKSWQQRIADLKAYLAKHPEANIPEFESLSDHAWVEAASGKLETETEFLWAMARLRQSAQLEFANKLSGATSKYLQVNNGQPPANLSQLQPYFESPVSEAILRCWDILPATEAHSLKGKGEDWMITQKAAVDDSLDSRIGIGPNGMRTTGVGSYSFAQDMMVTILKAYCAANNTGQPPKDPSQLLPFATTDKQKVQLEKIIEQFNRMTASQQAGSLQSAEKLVKEILSDSK
jgi:hypothetical protein